MREGLARLFATTFGVRCHHGKTRAVAVVDGIALKVALDDRGLRCNRFEQHAWTMFGQHETRGPRLCPVPWSDPRGRVLAMPAASPLSGPQFRTMRRSAQNWWGYDFCGPTSPWEHKPQDWGVLDGRIVAVDYAGVALFPLNKSETTRWGFEN